MTCGRVLGYTCNDNPTLRDPGCGEHFGSLRAFDAHMVGADRRCLTSRQLLGRGFRRKSDGAWSNEPPMTTPAQASFGLRRGRPRKSPGRHAGRVPPVSGTRGRGKESEADAAGDSA